VAVDAPVGFAADAEAVITVSDAQEEIRFNLVHLQWRRDRDTAKNQSVAREALAFSFARQIGPDHGHRHSGRCDEKGRQGGLLGVRGL